MTERNVLILALRAMLARDRAYTVGEHDYDVEEVLMAARKLGVDVDAEQQRAFDRHNIPASEFDVKWGKK